MPMSNAAIYARVSSARQKEQETIRSQTVALHAHAEQLGLDVPEQWVFEDDGQSGASLVRPALDRLRDLVCQVPVDVLLVYSPDRLARKYAYQALLIEEFAKAGTTVMFVNGPRSDSPEDALLVQFQGMIAEYERAQILERTRRGKAHRAKSGTINVLSGAPFGYRYVRKSEHAEARYEIVAHEAAIVAELFARYADGGVAIGELARWLSGLGVATRTGKPRWDRSTVWGMLRNPAYAGLACFGKTMRTDQTAGLNRTARLAGRATPRCYTVIDRARSDWLEIPVPALVAEDTWQRVQRRLADNKRYAARNSRNPSLLQGICACSRCGYAYYRTSTRTTNKKIYYYRCLGSDDYRYEHGRVCANKPVRADYLDTVVWNHITALLADPALIRSEINKRLEQVRTADPATAQRQRLDAGLAKATTAITRLIGAYQEELISLDELRTRMPELRARQTSLHHQIDALDSQLADREVYLKLADNLEDFLTGLRGKAATATVAERQRVLRLLVKDVLVGADKITIRHSIPVRHNVSSGTDDSPETDSEGEIRPDCQLRWRSRLAGAGQPVHALRVRCVDGSGVSRASGSSAMPMTRSCTASPNAKPATLVAAIGDRMEQVGLRAASRQDEGRVLPGREAADSTTELTAFTFLGFTFRARAARHKGTERCSSRSSRPSARTPRTRSAGRSADGDCTAGSGTTSPNRPSRSTLSCGDGCSTTELSIVPHCIRSCRASTPT